MASVHCKIARRLRRATADVPTQKAQREFGFSITEEPTMNLPPSKPSTAYAGGRAIKLAPLGCPYCRHEFRAQDVEPLGDGDVRLVCPGCHRDMLMIER